MEDSMENMPCISVIIPVYNVAKYVRYAIEDVINQSYNNIEIIIIDDGSNDGSEDIVDEYLAKDSRITVFHQSNQGLSAARNKGIELSKGDYIYFFDSDDRIHPDLIKRLFTVMCENKCEIVESGAVLFAENYELEDYFKQSIDIEGKVHIYSRYQASEHNMTDGKISIPIQNKLYKKELFYNIKFPVGKLHEDEYTTYLLIWSANRLASVDDKLFFYRIKRKGSILNSPYNVRRLDCLEARKMRYEFYKRIGEEKLYQFAVSLWMNCAISSVTKLKESKIDNYTVYVSDIKKEMRKVLRMEMKFKYIKAKRKIGHLIKYFIVQI